MSGAPITAEQRQKILEAVAKGVHPQVACSAVGLNRSYYKLLRHRARNGDASAERFVEDIEAAEAQGEICDVEATTRAVQPLDDKPIECPECGAEYRATPEQLAAEVARLTDVAKAKGLAAEVALKKLERRHPKRWSQKIVHTVQEEHDRLLNVCQRVLAPEVFELLLEEYLAEGSSEGEAGGDQGEQTGGGVH